MDKYRHFKNYTLYRFDSSYYYCKWLPTAVYYGYNPGNVNEKIIRILFFKPKYDIENIICLCSSDGKYNCSIYEIGPVYPGQDLMASFTLPYGKGQSMLHAKICYCKVAHQNGLIFTLSKKMQHF